MIKDVFGTLRRSWSPWAKNSSRHLSAQACVTDHSRAGFDLTSSQAREIECSSDVFKIIQNNSRYLKMFKRTFFLQWTGCHWMQCPIRLGVLEWWVVFPCKTPKGLDTSAECTMASITSILFSDLKLFSRDRQGQRLQHPEAGHHK